LQRRPVDRFRPMCLELARPAQDRRKQRRRMVIPIPYTPSAMFTRTSRRHRSVWSFRDRPSVGWRGEFQIGTPERWNDASIRSRPKAPWGHPRRRSADTVETNRGRQSAIGYPSSGGVSGPPQSRNLRPWLDHPLRGRAESPNSVRPRRRTRLAIRRRWSGARAAQFAARQPENAFASA
jgi:hypothetical protein